MKYIYLVFLMTILGTNNLLGQNLTFSQLIELRKMELGTAEEFLTAKGWEFSEASEPEDGKLGSATFTYKKDEMSSRAQSFLTYLYSSISNTKRVSIQVNLKTKYNEYLNSLKASGFKLTSSKVEEGSLKKIYKSANLVVQIRASTSTNFFQEETAIWHILLCTKTDYELEYE